MIAKLGMSELHTSPYAMLDDITKNNIVHIDKGEILMIQPAIRQPIKVVFPRSPQKTHHVVLEANQIYVRSYR